MTRVHSIALRNARLGFPAGTATRWILDGVSLALGRGDTVSVLGRSGCGKTLLSRLMVGWRPAGAGQLAGDLVWAGEDGEHAVSLAEEPRDEPLAELWGRSVAYVPQGGTRNLNPALTVRDHLSRSRRRAGLDADDEAALSLLREVGFSDPVRVWTRRPRALSGGMARRVLIALALAGAPDLLVVDEPTTGLDSDRRDRIVRLLLRSQSTHGFGLLMVTHEVGDAVRLGGQACVLAGGQLVERLALQGEDLALRPTHAATRELIDAWQWRGWDAGAGGTR